MNLLLVIVATITFTMAPNEVYSQRRICLFFSNSSRLVGLRAWQKGSTIKLPLILLNYYIVIKIAKIVDTVGKYV